MWNEVVSGLAIGLVLFVLLCLVLLAVNARKRGQAGRRKREPVFDFRAERVEEPVQKPPPVPEGYYLWMNLTDREKEVARLYGDGWTSDEVADELMIARHTVKVHARNIFVKLSIHSQWDLGRIIRDIEKYDRQTTR